MQLFDDPKNLLDDPRRKPERGLVHEQEPGSGHERASNGQHLLLTAGERARQLLGALAQDGKGLADPLDVSGDRRPVRLPAVGAHEEIFVHRHLSEDPAALRDQTDAQSDDLLGPQVDQVSLEELDLPRGGSHQPRNAQERRCLADSVGADQADDLALFDIQGDAVDGDDAAVADFQVTHFEHRLFVLPSKPR